MTDYLEYTLSAHAILSKKLRWSQKIGQVAKVYSPREGGICDDDETTIHGGVQGERELTNNGRT